MNRRLEDGSSAAHTTGTQILFVIVSDNISYPLSQWNFSTLAVGTARVSFGCQ